MLSSAEAEFDACSEEAKEIMFIKSILETLGEKKFELTHVTSYGTHWWCHLRIQKPSHWIKNQAY
jgi:succinate-acetate transporter protein